MNTAMAQSQQKNRVLTQPENAPRRRRIFYSEQEDSEEIIVRYLDELDVYAGFVFRHNEPLGSEKSVRATQGYHTWPEARRAAIALAAN